MLLRHTKTREAWQQQEHTHGVAIGRPTTAAPTMHPPASRQRYRQHKKNIFASSTTTPATVTATPHRNTSHLYPASSKAQHPSYLQLRPSNPTCLSAGTHGGP